MTVDEFELFISDTKISVRDIRTGKYLKDKRKYGGRKVQEIYARTHKYQGKNEANIVLMVRWLSDTWMCKL